MVTNTEVGDVVIKSRTYDYPVESGGGLVYRGTNKQTLNIV